ncbi:(2Fe-2S)-binding protein [Thermotoga profunda]|uniref:(2Fe-2S)-binding protein n=1 Tax=Thermotoga profunda TaxID=1508420 RepID=UPI0005971A35|nr:(2Fe-2S)-binding protein [Thermotoga profunda]
MDEEVIVCRCEEITLKEIREAIRSGHTTISELKRLLRVGMGPCQGRGCREIILREISQITKVSIDKLNPGRFRPPVKPIPMGLLSESDAKRKG